MFTKEELKIVELYKEDLFSSYSIREVMRKLGKRSYNWTFNATKKMVGQNILQSVKKGSNYFCSFNLGSHLALAYLSLIEEINAINKKNLPHANIKELIDIVQTRYFSFIITGSYAKGKETKKSDIDIAVIVADGTNKKRMLNKLRNKSDLMVPQFHIMVFNESEFLEMLTSSSANYGKLLFKNHLIYYGAQPYYSIIKKAVKNGFRGA